MKLLISDHRFSLQSVKEAYKTWNEKGLEEIIKIKAQMQEPLWTLRRVCTLKTLSSLQQYQLMVKMEKEGKVDLGLGKLLMNQRFIDAYLSDNEVLAQALNTRDVKKIPHVNHAAAAALAAEEIEAFNDLVPLSSQTSY
ncbi:Hypothetical protein POVR1_LOCUS414 [uncultured virus]|nr:Hypothetical protein POVR1_LOCUS414 [uncultured virus]